MGRLKTESDGKGNITQYEYNTLGDITKITYPDGNTSSNEYDYVNNDITI